MVEGKLPSIPSLFPWPSRSWAVLLGRAESPRISDNHEQLEILVQGEPPGGGMPISELVMGARNSQIVSGALKSSLGNDYN